EGRLNFMRANSIKYWPRGRRLIIIDEFAQLTYQNPDPTLDPAERKKQKATQDKMIADICKLGMLGRSSGITLICATQKPTIDSMPSALRTNLDAAIMFRSKRLLASSIFGDTTGFIFNPEDLSKGHAIAWLNGTVRYMQSYVV